MNFSGRSRALNRMKEQAEGRLREVEKPDNFNSVTEQARALTGAEPVGFQKNNHYVFHNFFAHF